MEAITPTIVSTDKVENKMLSGIDEHSGCRDAGRVNVRFPCLCEDAL